MNNYYDDILHDLYTNHQKLLLKHRMSICEKIYRRYRPRTIDDLLKRILYSDVTALGIAIGIRGAPTIRKQESSFLKLIIVARCSVCNFHKLITGYHAMCFVFDS